MIAANEVIKQVYRYFDKDLEENVSELEKRYLDLSLKFLGFCEDVEEAFEKCKSEPEAYNVLLRLADEAREYLAEAGR